MPIIKAMFLFVNLLFSVKVLKKFLKFSVNVTIFLSFYIYTDNAKKLLFSRTSSYAWRNGAKRPLKHQMMLHGPIFNIICGCN